MEIRLSKYNYPFSEPIIPDVHYISLDHQLLIKLGLLDAHVQDYFSSLPAPKLSRTFRTFKTSDTLEVFDPLSGKTFTHTIDRSLSLNFQSSNSISHDSVDMQFVHQLRNRGVKASFPSLLNCSCGNARRPWRCKCHKIKS